MADPNFLLRCAKALVSSSASDESQIRRLMETAEGDWLALQEASSLPVEEGSDDTEAKAMLRRAAALVIEGN